MRCSLSEWLITYKNPDNLIVQASSVDGEDQWMGWPIGMSWQYVSEYGNSHLLQLGDHSLTVLCAIRDHTDRARRPDGFNRTQCLEILGAAGIRNQELNSTTYYRSLPNYKFAISPEGNGIDCHRHYESLLAGVIPIIEDSPQMRVTYEGCPVLWTRDYSEINESYLLSVYSEMLETTYDFSRLLLSNYCEQNRQEIRVCSEYWINRSPNKSLR